jgi:hypothetical protein
LRPLCENCQQNGGSKKASMLYAAFDSSFLWLFCSI